MQLDEGERVDATDGDHEQRERFMLPVSGENVAIGRLGRICKALDRKTGRMLAVECIDIVDDASEAGEGGTAAEIALQMLATELRHCRKIINGEKARHVLCYDSVSSSCGRLYLHATCSVVRSLSACQQDFGRLHPLVVKQYIYQVVCGLVALHESGISCGGILMDNDVCVSQLSLSSLLLCGGNVVKIAAWFPSVQAVDHFQAQGILADSEFRRSSFGLPEVSDGIDQDVRSVAYVMLEMLTGLRVHGALMEKANMLTLTPLRSVLAHPYFLSASSTHGTMIHDSPQAAQEQQHIIGILTKQELTKCQTMKRQYLQQIRAWQVQFEKKYRRKAKSADLPAGIVRLQGRSQALNDRIQELNDRLAVAHGSIYRMISGKEALAVDASTQEDSSIQHEIRDESSASSPIESNASRSDSFGRGEGKRSPAQKAFLNRFSSSQ